MYTYLCKLLYTVDDNIPNEVGHVLLIKSDSNELEKLPEYKLNEYWMIQELLYENDCEKVHLQLLSKEDESKYSDLDFIVINAKDLD